MLLAVINASPKAWQLVGLIMVPLYMECNQHSIRDCKEHTLEFNLLKDPWRIWESFPDRELQQGKLLHSEFRSLFGRYWCRERTIFHNLTVNLLQGFFKETAKVANILLSFSQQLSFFTINRKDRRLYKGYFLKLSVLFSPTVLSSGGRWWHRQTKCPKSPEASGRMRMSWKVISKFQL